MIEVRSTWIYYVESILRCAKNNSDSVGFEILNRQVKFIFSSKFHVYKVLNLLQNYSILAII